MNLGRLDFAKAYRVTCVADASLGAAITEAARSLGVADVLVQSARTAVLRERRFLAPLRGGTQLEDDLVNVYRMLTRSGTEAALMGEIVAAAGLHVPGRGTVYGEPVNLYGAEVPEARGRLGRASRRQLPALRRKLVLICCIVPRGEANSLAKALLEMGLAVPTVTYGAGMGLRNKLGLLRITIPVDKEVIEVIVDKDDATEAFSYLTDAARLRVPGKGFMYMSPVPLGLSNTRIYRGEVRHVASMEQVIAAIDTLTRDTQWRRKSYTPSAGSSREFSSDMVSYTITCREGELDELVGAAMAAGAGGATMRKLRSLSLGEDGMTRTMESSDLIIPSRIVERVQESVVAAGAAGSHSGWTVEVSDVEGVISYQHQ